MAITPYMSREEFDELRPRVLEAIKEIPPQRPRDFHADLMEAVGLTDRQTRDVLGRLLNDGDLLFSKSRNFEAASLHR